MDVPAGVTFYEISVAAHVMLVVLAFGPTFAFPIIQMTAERRYPRQLPFALTLIERISRGIVTPAAVLVGATGLYQALDGPYEFGEATWMDVGFFLYLVILITGILLLEPATRRGLAAAERMVESAGPEGEVVFSDEYRRAMRLPNVLGPILSLSVLVVVYLMVVKPF